MVSAAISRVLGLGVSGLGVLVSGFQVLVFGLVGAFRLTGCRVQGNDGLAVAGDFPPALVQLISVGFGFSFTSGLGKHADLLGTLEFETLDGLFRLVLVLGHFL